MFKNGHQPDTQGNSKDGLEGELAQGSSTEGMEGGALGDASASDVTRGYSLVDKATVNSPDNPTSLGADLPMQDGFLGRARGWER